ncbi:MAG TPA: SAM-dependent methyltransferase, partial [Candidatus Omnitrophica bacterium]|nr:SAM-dependent methyltransferase [Candidatus Omnitrophota bacterium]
FSLQGLKRLWQQAGFTLVEVSTPGMLDVEIVQRHLTHDPSLPLSAFERHLLDADQETRDAFQAFLQQQGLSSFARLVVKKL